jgi:hypothetical protein
VERELTERFNGGNGRLCFVFREKEEVAQGENGTGCGSFYRRRDEEVAWGSCRGPTGRRHHSGGK